MAKKKPRKVSRKAAKKAVRRPAAKTRTVKKPVAKKAAAKKPAARLKDGRPPNYYAWLTPYLTVRDVRASQQFYAKAFGCTMGMAMPGPGGKIMHGDVGWQGTTLVMMGPENPQMSPMRPPASSGTPSPLSLYVYCRDVDALHARAGAAGAKVMQAPADQFWGDRTAIFEDPDGYHWTFATNVGEFDPSKAPF